MYEAQEDDEAVLTGDVVADSNTDRCLKLLDPVTEWKSTSEIESEMIQRLQGPHLGSLVRP